MKNIFTKIKALGLVKVIAVALLLIALVTYTYSSLSKTDAERIKDIVAINDEISNGNISYATAMVDQTEDKIKELSKESFLYTVCKTYNEDRKGKSDMLAMGCQLDTINEELTHTGSIFKAYHKELVFNDAIKQATPPTPKQKLSPPHVQKLVNSNGKSQAMPVFNTITWQDRMDELLIVNGRIEDVTHGRWLRVADKHRVHAPLLVCIAKADSSLGRALKTTHNIGNVGNNDRGDRVHFATAIQGIDAIGQTLNNKYLGRKQSVGSLSVGGGGSRPYYATSKENWNINVINCLRGIYNDYTINENWIFRYNSM